MPKLKIEELIQKINTRDLDKGIAGSSYLMPHRGYDDKGTIREEDFVSNSNDEKQFLEMTISSEYPVEDYFGFLILDHSEGAIVADRLKTGASFRDGHYGDQVGIISNYSITPDRKLKIGVNFSPHNPRAIMLYKDYRDRFRKNTSVRFLVHELVLEKTIEDVNYYRAMKWEFIHGAGVEDGADPSVGVDRNFNKPSNTINIRSNTMTPEEIALKEKQDREAVEKAAKERELQIQQERNLEAIKIKERAKAHLKPEQQQLLDRVQEKGGADAVINAASIYEMARTYQKEFDKEVNLIDLADKYVNLGTSERKFGDMITDLLTSKAQKAATRSLDGLGQKDRNQFSISKLIHSIVPESKVNIDREIGIIKEYEEQNGISLQSKRGGRVIPIGLLFEKQRTLVAGTSTQAGNLIGTNLMPSEFIPLARSKAIVDKLGIKVWSNLVGNPAVPTQTAAASGAWMADEVTPPSASDLTTGQKTLTPRTYKIKAAFSRLANLQSTPNIEQIAVDDLINVVSLVRDKSVHHGAGSGSNEPTGIVATSGVGLGTVKTTFTFADIIAMETAVAAANLDVESMAYVTTPTLRGTLKGTEKATNQAIYLWDKNEMNGYKAFATNQITTGFVFFGDYSQIVLGEWGGLELVYNPYTYDGAIIQVSAYLTMDVVLRYAAAFSYYKPS